MKEVDTSPASKLQCGLLLFTSLKRIPESNGSQSIYQVVNMAKCLEGMALNLMALSWFDI
jgi:hypothetical protein